MNLSKSLYFIIVTCLLLTSCRAITALKKMNAEKADYEIWSNKEGKSVLFLPMAHAGRPEFYQDVRKIILEYKSQGYVVFYEGIKRTFNQVNLQEDSISKRKYAIWTKMYFPEKDSTQLICLLKFKRFIRIIPDSASYSKVLKSSSLTNKAVMQPSAASLGISDPDVNIDVPLAELVDEYERRFGTITLEQIDFAVPLNEQLPRHRRLKKKRATEVILDYRNKNLSNNIQSSSYRKILVVYGLAHKKGTFKALKKADQSWKVVESY